MEQILKRIKYIAILCLIIAAFIGGRYSNHTDVVYQQDVKPTQYTVLKPVDNTDISDLIARANTPIEVYRELDKSDLTIRATDGYKQTIVHDRFYSKQKPNFVFAGLGADKNLTLIYSVGYMRQIYPVGLFCGGYVSFNQTSVNSINAIAGYSF